MRRVLIIGPFITALFIGAIFWTGHIPLPDKKTPLRFYSNHKRDDLRLLFCSSIKAAKSSIYMATYGLSDPYIISALNTKAQQGLDIHLFLDSTTPSLVKKKFPIKSPSTSSSPEGSCMKRSLLSMTA